MKNYEKCYELVKTIIYERGRGVALSAFHNDKFLEFWNLYTIEKSENMSGWTDGFFFFVNISPGFNNKSSKEDLSFLWPKSRLEVNSFLSKKYPQRNLQETLTATWKFVVREN